MNRILCAAAAANAREALAFLPPDTALLWFVRLTALRLVGMLPQRPHAADIAQACASLSRHALFSGGEPVPALSGAAAALEVLSDADFREEPMLPGWLLEAYRSPDRRAAFAGVRTGHKLDADALIPATQVFTPRWLTRYMVHNALACLCSPPDTWEDLLPPAGVPSMQVSDITVLDPCMGCGHILEGAFDALLALHVGAGERPEDSVRHILTRQLFGLEVDPLAAKLAAFLLCVHASRYDGSLLHDPPDMALYDFSHDPDPRAPLLGSLMEGADSSPARTLLSRQYDAVLTNPPYMGAAAMDRVLSDYVRTHFPDSKADLCTCFIERCQALTRPGGAFSLLTQHTWMFLPRLRRLRGKLLGHCTLQSLVHLGTGAFDKADIGTIVQAVCFTAVNAPDPAFPTTWLRLVGAQDKEAAFHDPSLRYVGSAQRFAGIPGEPLCYWASDRMLQVLHGTPLSQSCRICQGMTTSDNRRFVRRWYEVQGIAFGCRSREEATATGATWFPYNKGGRVRRWYGNHTHVVDFGNDGAAMRAFHDTLRSDHAGGRIKNADMYFRPGITWSFITDSTRFGVRLEPEGFLFDVSGSCLFPPEGELYYLMGLLSSGTVSQILQLYNPTMNFQAETLGRLPVIYDTTRREEIEALVRECITLSREDWDEAEESWDFRVHPLLTQGAPTLQAAAAQYLMHCDARTERMRQCESALSQMFADIYGLPESCPPGEPTLRRHTPETLARALVSFAAGCLFGRYTHPGVTPVPGGITDLSALPGAVESLLCYAFGPGSRAYLEEMLGEDLAVYCRRDFWRVHYMMYHKRPIYWLAVSGRRREVQALLYVHGVSSPLKALQGFVEACPPGGERDALLARIAAFPGKEPGPEAGIAERLKGYGGLFRG